MKLEKTRKTRWVLLLKVCCSILDGDKELKKQRDRKNVSTKKREKKVKNEKRGGKGQARGGRRGRS